MKFFQVAFILILTLSTSSTSLAADNIRNFAEKTVNRIMQIISDENMNEDKKSALLERTFLDIVDVQWIARFTLGRHWPALTPEQQNEFLTSYKRYLLNIYVPNFKKYNSDKITITSIQELGKQEHKEYLVKTTIENDRQTTAYSINFRVINKDDTFLVFDFITEGVSMIATQRAEFNAIISAHGIDYLLAKLKKSEAISN